jgi:pilus assembly protein Flp/PilA
MKSFMLKLWNDESGATMVEYGLMVALIAVVCIAAVSLLGTKVRGNFTQAAAAVGASSEEQCKANGGKWEQIAGSNPPAFQCN